MKQEKTVLLYIELSLLLLCSSLGIFFFFHNPLEQKHLQQQSYQSDQIIDSYKNVPVYYNGPDYTKDHGENFSPDGYYYGLKWQCVEFIKRFYYVEKHVNMPNGFGNAKDFFDPTVPQGGLNKERGLIQFRNGGNMEPKPDDILVFNNSAYGHVAIVTKVTSDSIEVIQQNEKNSRQVFKLEQRNHHFFVGTSIKPAGWLRKV